MHIASNNYESNNSDLNHSESNQPNSVWHAWNWIRDQATYQSRKHVVDWTGSRHTIFLAGSGRSGTTWLSNVLNYDRTFRYLFEPFHPGEVSIVRHFADRQYVDPENRDPKLVHPIRRIVSGRINNRWVNKFNQRAFAQRRLIKAIRANMMIGWLKKLNPDVPFLYLIRNPFDVVRSQLACGWKLNPNTLISQSDLNRKYLLHLQTELSSLQTPFENLFGFWAIENHIALDQIARTSGIRLVFHEKLTNNPEPELRKIFQLIDRPFCQTVFNYLSMPSKTTRLNSCIRSERNRNKQDELSQQQIARGNEILRWFGLEDLFDNDGSLKTQNYLVNS